MRNINYINKSPITPTSMHIHNIGAFIYIQTPTLTDDTFYIAPIDAGINKPLLAHTIKIFTCLLAFVWWICSRSSLNISLACNSIFILLKAAYLHQCMLSQQSGCMHFEALQSWNVSAKKCNIFRGRIYAGLSSLCVWGRHS